MIILAAIWIGLVVTGRHLASLLASLDLDLAQSTAWIGAGIQLIAITPLLMPLALFWPTYRKSYFRALLFAHGFGIVKPNPAARSKNKSASSSASACLGSNLHIWIKKIGCQGEYSFTK